MSAYGFEVAGWGRGLLHYAEGMLVDLDEPAARTRTASPGPPPRGAEALVERLAAYLRGEPIDFADVDRRAAYTWFGLTPLACQLLEVVCSIPRGETASYGEVAALAGHPGAARAAGAACGRGPLSIIVPYHRVIRGDGTIGMYGELGVERKRRLLELEGVRAR